MIKPWRFYAVVLSASAAFSLAADESPAPVPDVEIHGPNVRPGYPDAFALGYKLADNSISPDGNYAVIYADARRIDYGVARNFLVGLKPFRILAVTEGDAYYGNQRDIGVQWAKDNSAVLVNVDGKWGPIAFTLFELQDGRVKRRTDLYAEIVPLLEPGFRKAKVEPWNDIRHFNFVGEGPQLENDGRQIRFDVEATNNPKPMDPPMKTWSGHLEGTWSIPKARWLTRKVTNDTYRQ